MPAPRTPRRSEGFRYTCRQETYRGLLPDGAEKTVPFNGIRYITDIER